MIRCGIGIFAVIAFASQASAQTLGQASEDGVSFWRVAGALLFCLILGIGAILILRARNGALPTHPLLTSLVPKNRRLQLIEVLRLNQHVDLCMVSCDGKTMLLATSSRGVDILPLPEISASGGSSTMEQGE
ncbi:MAG TPA: hypothetical protein VGE05_11260 [Novosphingobium sp.]